MKLPAPPGRALSEQTMLPLVNIVFLLMIFFMLAGAVAVPGAFEPDPILSAGGTASDRRADTLLVSAQGEVALGDTRIQMSQLQEAIRTWRIAHPGQSLSILADGRLPAHNLIALMESLKGAGLDEFRLMTWPVR